MSTETARPPATQGAKYMTLLAALLGWMFDGFEMGLFPLIGKPALGDLLGAEGAKNTGMWFGIIIAVFLVGAATGGVLFGWLGDKIGRVRAMSLSIFTYAIFTGLCGFATEAWHIAVLRFIASLGMGGEWSLGVALVNEIWPGKSRAFIAGLIGAAANVGFLLVALLSMSLSGFIGGVEGLLKSIGLSDATTAKLLANSAWRFLMISGAFPALLIFFIRLFVPESEKWEEEKAKGATSHWSNADLIGVFIGCGAALGIIYVWSPAAANISGAVATLITLVGLVVALLGYLYPVRQYLARATAAGSLQPESQGKIVKSMLLGAGLASVALLGTWGSIQWAPGWADQLQPNTKEVKYYAKEKTQIATAVGAIVATIAAAVAAGRFGRRITYTVMCVGSIVSALWFYNANSTFGTGFLVAAFLAGGITASFYGFFPLYFPELFPTAVRATGQGFSFNFGRIVAAIGGLQTATLMKAFDGSFPKAGSVMAAIYVIGIFIIWLGPETKDKELPE
ncbi:MAG: major facilitator superfamily protein [Limisphaerales bacterium]|nr:MAG: major facilitator superfamily protein [Limisphaerales bacterium]KAG0508987.1 MAG: major facilitator superfamily protein [Limisphaerales bacterium]TXT51292.1 MAG: major facilitator superfamily protein [Limisphaerales bacterium]